VAGAGSGPRHLLGADAPAAPAGKTANLRLEQQPARAQVEVAPAPDRGVVGCPDLVPAGTGEPPEAPLEGHDHAGGCNSTPITEATWMASIVLNAVLPRTCLPFSGKVQWSATR
jgi:hypothetical protein